MSDDFLNAFGAVTVEFAILEIALETAICILLVGTKAEDQAEGQIVTAELSFRRQVDLFAALVRHRFPDESNAVKELCKKLFDVERQRNEIIHSTWTLPDKENKVVRLKTTARGELKTKFEKISAADIRARAERIRAAVGSLNGYYLPLAGITLTKAGTS